LEKTVLKTVGCKISGTLEKKETLGPVGKNLLEKSCYVGLPAFQDNGVPQ